MATEPPRAAKRNGESPSAFGTSTQSSAVSNGVADGASDGFCISWRSRPVSPSNPFCAAQCSAQLPALLCAWTEAPASMSASAVSSNAPAHAKCSGVADDVSLASASAVSSDRSQRTSAVCPLPAARCRVDAPAQSCLCGAGLYLALSREVARGTCAGVRGTAGGSEGRSHACVRVLRQVYIVSCRVSCLAWGA
jgi:hypothetical protein